MAPSDCNVSLSFPPDELEVRQGLAALRAGLSHNVGSGHLDTIEIVTAEVLNNIVEHAFTGQDTLAGKIHLNASFKVGRVCLSVEDNGVPMPEGMLPQPQTHLLDPSAPETLPEGGFGWGLIHTLCAELNYTRDGDWNRLSAAIDIS